MINKINSILDKKEKIKLTIISLGGLISSIFEIIGIGTAGPILLGILNPKILADKINQFDQLSFLNAFEISNLILMLFLIFFVSFTFKSLFSFYISTKIIKTGVMIQKKLRSNFIYNYTHLKYEKITSIKSSDIFHYVGHITRTFCQNVVVKIFMLISDSIIFFAIITLMMFTNLKLFLLIFTILILSYLFYFFFIRSKIEIYGRLFGKSDQSFLDISKSIINGFKTIKILQIDKKFIDIFEKNNTNSSISEYNYSKILLLPKVILEISFIFIVAAIFSLSLFLDGDLSNDRVALLGIFAIASARSIPLIYNIFNSIGNIMGSKYTIEKIYNEIKNIKDVEKPNISQKINFDFQLLNFKNVCFNYKNNEKILNNINLEIKKNNFIAVVGPSGSGKTTLIDLVCGFLHPVSGEIFINNTKNIKSIIPSWRGKIAYIPQENFIFNGSILENITFKKDLKEVDTDRFDQIIEQTKVKEFLIKKNKDFNFEINEDGKNLSGGQAQRISIARALYFKRELLIFDESLNSLNEDLQVDIIQECKNIKRDLTLILITHNKSILKHFDKVIEL